MKQEEEHHSKSNARLLLSHAAARLGVRWWDMYYVERSLKRPLPEFVASLPLECSLATADDQKEILRKRAPSSSKLLQQRFASDDVLCYVARSEGNLVGHSMLRSGLMDMTGLDAEEILIRPMPVDTGLTHDAFVWPEFRDQHIFHALLLHMYKDRQAAGYVRICNLIDPANLRSLKVHLDMGARVQRVKFLKLPGTGAIVAGQDFAIGELDP